MLDNKCIFCDKIEINKGLLDETDNFYFRAVMKGAIAPGHVLLISKKHFSCFGEMPSYLHKEYSNFVDQIEERVKNAFSTPILIEQGVHGQSIQHAHLHFFPDVSEQYDFTNEKRFIDFINPTFLITETRNISDIHKVFEQEGQYVSIKERGRLYIYHTKDYNGPLRVMRTTLSKLTGSNNLLYWQTMPDSEKEKNRGWINKTIQKLKKND